MHACHTNGSCPTEVNEEGHEICTVTGFCIKMLSFSDKEFHSTIGGLYSSSLGVVVEDFEVHCDFIDESPSLLGSHRKRKCMDENEGDTPRVQAVVASAGKKNRYRSWVHQRIQTGSNNTTTSGSLMVADEVGALIESYIRDILCSSKWQDCMRAEASP
jgi:hypothetical protein